MSDEAFAHDVLKIAVAQACNQMDFTNIEAPALESLIDLLIFCTSTYLRTLQARLNALSDPGFFFFRF